MANRDDQRGGYRGTMGHGGETGRGERERWYADRDRERDERMYAGRERDEGEDRTYDPEADMGGTGWSGSSGRGGVRHREHEGFSNYAGGGDRDMRHMRMQQAERPYGALRGGYGGQPRFEEDHRGPVSFSRSDMGFGWRERDARDEPRGPHYGKGPKGYKRSDERIREEVCETIAQQGWIDASDVEVNVDDGVVTLSGTVAERGDKRGLEQLAERVYGVDEVRNEIRLRRFREQEQQRPQQQPQREERPQQRQQQPSGPGSGYGDGANGNRSRS